MSGALQPSLCGRCAAWRQTGGHTFTSEDRIVKQFMRRESQDCLCPPRQPVCTCGHKASIKELSRRPVLPTAAEILENPRSRSALENGRKTGVVEKKE
jgi:16S rRNA (cytosine1402-N4)-methyltransferase